MADDEQAARSPRYEDLLRLFAEALPPGRAINPDADGKSRLWVFDAGQPDHKPLFAVREDWTVPPDEIRFERDGTVVGRIVNIARPEPVEEQPRKHPYLTYKSHSVEAVGVLTDEGRRLAEEAIKASLERMVEEAVRASSQRMRDYFDRQFRDWPSPRHHTVTYEPPPELTPSRWVMDRGRPVVMEPKAYVNVTADLGPSLPRVPGRVIYEVYDVPLTRGGRRRHRRALKKKRGRS